MTTEMAIEEEKGKVEEKLRALLDVLEYDVTLTSEVQDGNRLYFNIEGEDNEFFMGHRGDVLRNLTFLLHSYHAHHFPKSELEIKCDASHMLRDKEEEVRDLAIKAADGLEKPGDVATLDPLNAYERRIVHLALQERENLKTESIGDGHFKKVLIRFVGGDNA